MDIFLLWKFQAPGGGVVVGASYTPTGFFFFLFKSEKLGFFRFRGVVKKKKNLACTLL